MGARSGTALKFLQWFIRGVQFCCSAIILGIFAYFLATLNNHNLHISDDIRAVTGISGAAVIYTAIGLLLLCCLAGRTFSSLIAIILDLAFIGAFIYVAVANRYGANSCDGYVNTPYGRGQGSRTADINSNGFTVLPSFHTACRLQTACLAVSIIAIFFFILSILTEVALVRHHRKAKRFGPGPQNDYTGGYPTTAKAKRGGFLGRIFRRRDKTSHKAGPDDVLPQHATPEQYNNRQSYATDTAPINSENPYTHAQDQSKYETGYGYPNTATGNVGGAPALQQGPPQNYRYNDGVYDRF